ncbi:MAG: DUF3526 domain-containing protein [Roseivirga sp.]
MFLINFKRELQLLTRNGWFVALTLLLLILVTYAVHNGHAHYEQRQSELTELQLQRQTERDGLKKVADEMANGESPDNYFNVSPIRVSISTGALATIDPNPHSVLAIGQSDLYAQQFKVSSREDLALLSFTELSNPVQLLLGNFDLAFVVIYLLPLLVIAFSYNLFSAEKESGSLQLLAANPVNLKVWLLQKTLIRFIIVSLIFVLAVVGSCFLYSVPLDTGTFKMLLCALAYMSFWFSLTYLVGSLGRSSEKNAVYGIGLWIVLVLIIPSAVSQTANSIYPTPSRAVLINEVRLLKKEISKKQDEVLDQYLRNHPELAADDANASMFWKNYFASQEMMETSLEPLIVDFEGKLQQQQDWVSRLRFLSPAVVVMDIYNEAGSTSTRHYASFKDQVVDFHITWREHFLPFVFENKMLTSGDLDKLPVFTFDDHVVKTRITPNLIYLLIITLLQTFLGLAFRYRSSFLLVKN